ncbi:sugar kinase [Pseudoalteromonas phenolica]|uniref:PfkB family carbohydrate kinase n=1 Tax=Pseudoalteromonas phenolica TaxID=161398 RepID=UPI00110AB3F2|nr:PfkB family carbohydrate kinase [Pseudoalteromonas phenolica]TMN88567.1 sugar kinase [Pseudoalteromonas phenolica]
MTSLVFNTIKSMVFFGECMVEYRADNDISFAGDTFNTAWYFSQFNKGKTRQSVQYASAIGDDEASSNLALLLQQERLESPYLITEQKKQLGQYWVKLAENGERNFEFDRLNSPVRQYFNQDSGLLAALKHKQFDAIYLSGISLAVLCPEQRAQFIAALRQFKQRGGVIFFDNNYRAALWQTGIPKKWFQQLMALANVAFLTDEDEYAVYGTQCVNSIIAHHFSQEPAPDMLVIRCGSAPCVIALTSDDVLEVSPKKIAAEYIIDTTAAGDAFAAGFLVKAMQGETFENAAKFAHRLAGQVIQHHGALMPKDKLTKYFSEEL